LRQARGTSRVKRGMAEMLKGGVIMDVVTAEQAKIAEDAGAVAVMSLARSGRGDGRHQRRRDPTAPPACPTWLVKRPVDRCLSQHRAID
jgi:pyridoxal biosynthesis lyase PdxS